MKNFYAAITVQEDGKYYAYVLKISEADNALSALAVKGIVNANFCSTKAKAENTAAFWNKCFKVNGTYMFA